MFTDGGHIENLLITLLLHHLPELVKAGKVFAATPPLYRTQTAKETKYWRTDDSEFKKYMRNHKDVDLQRIKGLGEMGASELFSTTMDPANRELVQLTTDDIENTLELYDKLMGNSPSERRKFIMENKLSKLEEEDVFDDDFED